jgi:serine/threonine-protein kinase RIO1
MKNLIILITLEMFSSLSEYNSITANDVYICKGKSSKKYHYKNNCSGLSNCSTNIYNVSITEARNMRRTLCGSED